MSKPNPKILVFLGVASVLAVVGYFVDKQRQREQTTLSGFFESQPALLASRTGGRVSKIEVTEGQAVEGGKVVITLEADASQAQSAALRAQADQADAAYRTAVSARAEEIARQEALIRDLAAQLQKLRLGPRTEEIAGASAQLRGAEAKYQEVINGPRPEEIRRAQAALRQSQARLDKARAGASSSERQRVRVQIEAARTQEELTRKEADRQRFLFESGAAAKRSLEQAQAAYEAAAKQREALEQSEKDLNTRPEDIQAALAELGQVRAQLALLEKGSRKEDIAAARAVMDQARENLLLLRRGSRPEDISSAEAKLRQAELGLQALRSGSGTSKVDQAKSTAEAARSNYRSSTDTTRERLVKMPQAATIDRVLVAVGDLVAPGSPVLRISYAEDLYLRVYVPEAQLAGVKLGDDALLVVDGVEGEIGAVVESIGSQGEFTPANLQTPSERGKQVFAVRLRLKRPDSRIKPGMYASIRALGAVR